MPTFEQEVAQATAARRRRLLAIPFLTPAQLADPARLAAKYRIPLLNQVAVLGSPHRPRPASAPSRAAMHYLLAPCRTIAGVARATSWRWKAGKTAVHNGPARVRPPLFARIPHQREVPRLRRGSGPADGTAGIARRRQGPERHACTCCGTPYRLLRGLVTKAVTRPERWGGRKQPVLEDALTGWIDMLRKEAARQSGTHPLWAHVAQGFQRRPGRERRDNAFNQIMRGFQIGLAEEVERTARCDLRATGKEPVVLNTLRGGKFALDVAAIAGTLALGSSHWHGLHPRAARRLADASTRGTARLAGGRSAARTDAAPAAGADDQHLSAPLAEWLTAWPATGGSAFERLQLALRRIPRLGGTALRWCERNTRGTTHCV